MDSFSFQVGQVVERVYGEREKESLRNLLRRFLKSESSVRKFMEPDDVKDGDLFRVSERRMKDGHDLYLCINLSTGETTLFGRSGLREHIPTT